MEAWVLSVHVILVTITPAILITAFVSLIIFVLAYNPHRPLSWLFSLFCLTIIMIYLCSFFLVAKPDLSATVLNQFLRLKWVGIVLSPVLYLHLISFYFPQKWQHYRSWFLGPAYGLSLIWLLFVIGGDWVIAGFHYNSPPHIVGIEVGPLLPVFAGLFTVQIIGGAIGLLANYRAKQATSYHFQLRDLMWATGMALAGSLLHWGTVVGGVDFFLHETPDALLVVAAVLFISGVIRHGAFVGRLMPRRRLFYSVLTGVIGLFVLYITLTLDQWLTTYTTFPYPLATGVLVLLLVTTFPTLSHWLPRQLDRVLFQPEYQERQINLALIETLAQAPDLTQLQLDLLDTVCTTLNIQGGYIALATVDNLGDPLTVQAVYGSMSVQVGDQIQRPPLAGKAAQLITAVLPQTQLKQSWQEVAICCTLVIDHKIEGLLALGEKRDGVPFTPPDMTFVTELAKGLSAMGRLLDLREQRQRFFEAARLQEETLQQLEADVVFTPQHIVPAPPQSLKIRLLGDLQIVRNEQVIPEAEWGSEKAKIMLAYLLWKSPEGVTREDICLALWPERTLEEAANVFHVTLHRLRRVLLQSKNKEGSSATYILHDRGKYRFNTDLPHWLDVTTFEALIRQDNLSAFREAINLYQGSYLADSSWALPSDVEMERRRLEQLYSDALRRLANQASVREASYYLEKLLLVEPADEQVHRALILGYLSQGRTDLARHQAKRWQQSFTELDLEPSPETHAMWESLGLENNYTWPMPVKIPESS